jgi:hypothetical protein
MFEAVDHGCEPILAKNRRHHNLLRPWLRQNNIIDSMSGGKILNALWIPSKFNGGKA